HKHAALAKRDSVLAVPALVKIHPPPPATFIGATADYNLILRRLGIPIDATLLRTGPGNKLQS
ncbi:MAG TPA: circadian clock KaiB family protein, partial [Acidobacteriaceae bacterium]|nr:circadian clock KaiB family protein [Acidobacteriaceae bacterium]